MTRRWWWALAAAAVLAGAAGAVLAGATNAVLGISLRGQRHDVSPGPVLVSADGRVITLADRSASCLHPATVIVTESLSAVTILEQTAPDSPPIGCSDQTDQDSSPAHEVIRAARHTIDDVKQAGLRAA